MMRSTLFGALLLLLLSSLAGAASTSSEPLKIKSNELHADNEKKTAVFEGKVVARQGDMTLLADRVVISYGADGHELSRVEAFGNVRIHQGTRQAFGSHATYDNKARKIILDGSPKVLQGEDVITGKVITYYVDEQKSEVTGGPNERVEAVIHPGGKDAGKKP
ncbi:lipopolysaccharide transport periplasmic protein LptA [Geomesophilobacter sediminis]|uniref:Lipopolysaccharide transport periplasmic protein LptA n=1 Tax=Geomesophilobacter sediminis TaxID=2798584 RepID=A0A8J7LZ17_9BACT|nr:lipopolysaccharide transport periplasmic protein LptA [Geomesophilobacter sediminis]MBJ6725932.1 lipopolysaccharide transport periplasmic protein LptA [Geomesophilobacter sediminis]